MSTGHCNQAGKSGPILQVAKLAFRSVNGGRHFELIPIFKKLEDRSMCCKLFKLPKCSVVMTPTKWLWVTYRLVRLLSVPISRGNPVKLLYETFRVLKPVMYLMDVGMGPVNLFQLRSSVLKLDKSPMNSGRGTWKWSGALANEGEGVN